MKLWELTAVLCLIWALTLLYGEMLAFRLPSLSTCQWPHHHLDNYLKVAVLTDLQLMDRTSLPLPPNSLALELVQFYTDLYMRRAFLSCVLPFDPDVVLFLGDYFDGGPYLSDHEWKESLSRLKHIFSLSRKKEIQLYRFTTFPETMTSVMSISILVGHRYLFYPVMIMISVMSSTRRNMGLVKELTVGTISWLHGNVYPSFMLLCASNSNTSSSELDQLCFLPVQLHIYFWYISLFVLTLLSLLLWPSGGVNVWHYFSDLIVYGKQLVTSITSRPKENDEDLNCEYEMMWDAEGSIHLVKKALNAVVTLERDNFS